MAGVHCAGVERWSLLGGYLYIIKCMLKSIGAFVFGRSREVGRFWEGPLREVPLYMQQEEDEGFEETEARMTMCTEWPVYDMHTSSDAPPTDWSE